MAFSGIEEIARAEQQARERYNEAVAQAKHAHEVEQRVRERLLDDLRQNQEVDFRRSIVEAEARAAAQTEELLQNTRAQCESMKADARSRLDAAAALIVEKVVNNGWQS